MFDYVIIGAGIIGTSIAKELSRYKTSVLVLEKENDVANHQTVANSAIIHSGHDPKEGTLKAKLCIQGNQMYEDLEKDLGIPLLRTGAFVVAHTLEQENMLEALYTRGVKNGVKNMKMLTIQEALLQEPNLSPTITKVLSLPSTKVTYPWEVAFKQLECAIHNGVSFKKNSRVTAIKKVNSHVCQSHKMLENPVALLWHRG